MDALTGKVAVITGGTNGIGARIAEQFATEGADVIIAGRRQSAGDELADRLGSAVTFVRADVSVEDDVAALIGESVARFGRLDSLVNCAGEGPRWVASSRRISNGSCGQPLSMWVGRSPR